MKVGFLAFMVVLNLAGSKDSSKLVAENEALKKQIRTLEGMLVSGKKKDHVSPEQEAVSCDVQKHIHKKYQPQGAC
jgi:hypothetical protein